MRRSPMLVSCVLAVVAQHRNALAQDFGGMEANALWSPRADSSFAAIHPASAVAPETAFVAARLSFLEQPITLNLPSPSATGTDVASVAGAFILEASLATGLPGGFDWGVTLPAHLFQWGTALAPATGGEPLARVALADPRLTLGWSRSFGPWSIRPHGTAVLPLGQPTAFSGEDAFRGELGVACSWEHGGWTIAGDIAGRIRRVSNLGQSRWGPQARLGLGARYAWSDHWDAGVEIQLMPTLFEQPAPLLSEPGYVLPSEVAGTLNYSWDPWRVQLGLGTGLPTSAPSSVNPEAGLQRGPTAPNLRLLAGLSRRF